MAENQDTMIKKEKADHCSVCGKKLGMAQKMLTNTYSHMLVDGVPCTACDLQIRRLLEHRKLWVDEAVFKETMGKAYDWRKESAIPTEWAKGLFALRDSRCAEILGTLGGGDGVFAVAESFQVVPSPPIFILRAKKVRCKAVIRGLPIHGEFKKGGCVALVQNGVLTKTKILDAIPRGTGRFTNETFYDQLSGNVHDHTLSVCEEGWLILDMEVPYILAKGDFAAGIQ